MTRPKITIVGAGNVGATCAHWLATRELGDLVLIDIVEGLPQGKALDLLESCPVRGYDLKITGTNDYRDTADSEIVVITAGLPRKPGMSRDNLLAKNAEIVTSITEQVAEYSPEAVLLIVSNPLDLMTYLAHRVSGFPRDRVMGMAGILDTARFRTFIAQELGVSVKDVFAFVLGGHGDDMVPLPRLSTVAGIPLPELLPSDRIEALVERTRKGGGEIVGLLKTGSAYYAPSASVAAMVEAVVCDQKRILPSSVLLNGEYGVDGLFLGVPAKIGGRGMEQVVELDLTPSETEALEQSAKSVRRGVDDLKRLMGW